MYSGFGGRRDELLDAIHQNRKRKINNKNKGKNDVSPLADFTHNSDKSI